VDLVGHEYSFVRYIRAVAQLRGWGLFAILVVRSMPRRAITDGAPDRGREAGGPPANGVPCDPHPSHLSTGSLKEDLCFVVLC
ncbi:MAG: hypothetical protein M3423_05160, partial [Actinomycetota bacterium]|nr:hypothetical protein [Actinomycetota bacterium]